MHYTNTNIYANGSPLHGTSRDSFNPKNYRKPLEGEAPLLNGVPTLLAQLPEIRIGDGWVVNRQTGTWANVGSGRAMEVYQQPC